MMREQRTHHEVHLADNGMIENISGNPADAAFRSTCLSGNSYDVRIQIDPDKVHRYSLLSRPLLYVSQCIAVPAAHIHDADRFSDALEPQTLQPIERGPVASEPPVDASQIQQARPHLIPAAGLVH